MLLTNLFFLDRVISLFEIEFKTVLKGFDNLQRNEKIEKLKKYLTFTTILNKSLCKTMHRMFKMFQK